MTIGITPEYQTKGVRKKLRGEIRNWLGTSSEPAPRLGQVLAAVRRMDELLKRTSSGRYRLSIVDHDGFAVSESELREAYDAYTEW